MAGKFKVQVPQLIQIERQIEETKYSPIVEEPPEKPEEIVSEEPVPEVPPPRKKEEPDPFLSLPMNKQHDLTVCFMNTFLTKQFYGRN